MYSVDISFLKAQIVEAENMWGIIHSKNCVSQTAQSLALIHIIKIIIIIIGCFHLLVISGS